MNIKKGQFGVGMLEILISVVVMAIGLLGVAGLQTSSIRANHDAYVRTLVAMKASEIADRIRANPQGLADGDYDALTTLPSAGSVTTCTSTACTTSQLAVFDHFEWGTSLATLLPSGAGTVTGSGASSVFTITIRWDDARTGATGTACSSDTSVDLSCYSLSVRL